MTKCFGCGEDLSEEGERCLQCGLDIHLLKEIGVVHSRPRFLFGRVETPVSLSSKQEELEQAKDFKKPPQKAIKRNQKPKTKKSVARNIAQKTDSMSTHGRQDNDPILFRDEGLNLGELDVSFLDDEGNLETNETVSSVIQSSKATQWPVRLGSLLLNFLLFLLLNSSVLCIISLMTDRGCAILMRHSFLPLILVHLAFTMIVFSLFYYLYGYSPGKLALRKFHS